MSNTLQKINKFAFRLDSYIHRKLIKQSKNNRPASLPYITGDGFRSIADHIYDETNKTINLKKIKDNDIIFVNRLFLDDFFSEIHPKIDNKYVLLTHNHYEPITKKYIEKIDEKITKWYSQNVLISHPKIVTIPLGIENLYYYQNGIIKYFNKFKKTKKQKNKILFGFNINTNPEERRPAYENIRKNNYAEKITGWPNPKEYLKLLSKYKFVLSPPGKGVDCIRTWEAMYLNVVPIVKRSKLTTYYEEIGLPIWVVEEWSELDNLNNELIQKKYNSLKNKFNNPAIHIDYWANEMKKYAKIHK